MSDYFSSETGGQDDLVNIFSPWEQRVIARCQGHSSFLSALAFDDLRCDGRTYRFGSVGEDNKLILVKISQNFYQHRVDLSWRSGTFRAERFIVRSYILTTIASPWPHRSLLAPVSAPMRSLRIIQRPSSLRLAQRVHFLATIQHRPAMRSRSFNRCSLNSSRTTSSLRWRSSHGGYSPVRRSAM